MSCRHLTCVTCTRPKKRRWVDWKWFQGIDMFHIRDIAISHMVHIYPLKPVSIRLNRPLRICMWCHTSKTDIWQRRKTRFDFFRDFFRRFSAQISDHPDGRCTALWIVDIWHMSHVSGVKNDAESIGSGLSRQICAVLEINASLFGSTSIR